uniref:Uncharacterized protein n=1 Tax=Panagrolaimus sp. ES5 TaxID=591445 RepID=A0AC34GJ38_9BILA
TSLLDLYYDLETQPAMLEENPVPSSSDPTAAQNVSPENDSAPPAATTDPDPSAPPQTEDEPEQVISLD